MSNEVDDLLGELEGKKPAVKTEAKAAPAKVAAKAPAKKAAPAPTKKPVAKAATAKPAKAPAKPAPAKKAAAKPVAKAAAKPVAKAAAKPAAKAAKPAAKAAKPVVKAAPAKVAVKPASNFIVFAEGEREALCKRIKQIVRKPMNSRDLAAKLEIHSRKLRRVLYGMSSAGTIKLKAGTSRKHGMFAMPV